MTDFGEEKLIELAFAVSNVERLSAEDERLLEQIRKEEETGVRFDEYVRTIAAARAVTESEPASQPENLELSNLLAEYVDGELTDAERINLERRLVEDPALLDQLVQLSEFASEQKSPSAVFRYVVELASEGLRLVSHPPDGFAWVSSEPVPVLGPRPSSRIHRWTQQMDQVQVQCTLQMLQDASLTLTILLLSPKKMRPGTRANLRCAGRLVQSEPLAGTREITFTKLEPAGYELEISIPYTHTATMSFDVNRPA